MSLFIIGDVHGCFHSYLKLMDHWEPKTETLIQLGDLVDRGNFSPLTVRLAFEIKKVFKNSVHFLRGNHEQMMIKYLLGGDHSDHWLNNGGRQTLEQFSKHKIDPKKYIDWLNAMPLYWENKNVVVSHAGFSGVGSPLDLNNPDGVLWNRKSLVNLGKIQVIGHTPLVDGRPEFQSSSNSWNIDTGAYKGNCLTGIKLNNDGTFLEVISIPTDPKDIDNPSNQASTIKTKKTIQKNFITYK
ncbi:serine/threonine protein phosphatase [Belliella sp. R4-6]|uniref:Serine/threonine protein phosphatase n=1 Tax=Belliella alkalica TaxID=1730871 RepID=A0ABS9VAX9_9BACT|nr:metallophosphoesterase family protein [Belliella alkalica]MCH7413592.1 serine/threonine protein phosphatase [Belliella alkalica]